MEFSLFLFKLVLHSNILELIPGIGKTYMKTMLEEREKQKFESFLFQKRFGKLEKAFVNSVGPKSHRTVL